MQISQIVNDAIPAAFFPLKTCTGLYYTVQENKSFLVTE